MSKPRLLDLFCGAGCGAMGYSRAGLEVVGVDIAYQPHYPFSFQQGDALGFPSDGFDAIHASPPCQHHTKYRNVVKDITDRYEDLIVPTRERLESSGLPYVIENVESAPIRSDLMLCGSMFGLDVRRHRIFEFGGGWPIPTQPPCRHDLWTARKYKSSTGRKNLRYTIEIGSWDEPIALQRECMGVDWVVTTRELSEGIPPVYAEYIGSALVGHLAVRQEAA